ncbi:HAD family hydrolase [Caballeronia sp. LZ065]|uniref:HAD family hydrolase n=1 Tax=Caballeronia sp. LZ065 TaxID=3038571 RepID=UPI00285CFA91|nr:HAD family hydrolase [Caballeronia sp. LZ065]MDR5778507.1 HAD family hydrolase [Caballeronia sp. LZ065]
MIDHLICDCDGVLVDSEIIADRVMLDVLTETFPGIDFKPVVKTAFGQQTSRFLAQLEGRFGILMPPGFVDTIEARVAVELARSVGPIAGVRAALEGCGLPVAVVSNSRLERVRASVRRAGLEEIVGPRVFSAQQVERPKPYPDVYLLAARTLDVDPARCLVVEDSVAGLTAARAAGMKTIAFVGASHIPSGYAQVLRETGITRIMEHMDELPALVAAGVRGDFGDVLS